MSMATKDIVLNISVNMGRLCRWSMEGRRNRVEQFLAETNEYVRALDESSKSERFMPTYEWFKKDYERLSRDVQMNADWAESVLTWANILGHRASLT